MSQYVLENDDEFARLERQSSQEAYDFEKELQNLVILPGQCILDAGCGSGIVTRTLGEKYPGATMVGCDVSETRVELAKKQAAHLNNITFDIQNLERLSYDENTFDQIVCRYVIEHLEAGVAEKVFTEFFRCLKPNGQLHVIDIDGFLYNVHPTTPLMDASFTALQKERSIDMYVGRKLPLYFHEAGFKSVEWKIDTLQFNDENLDVEIGLMRDRLSVLLPFFTRVIGSAQDAQRFMAEYLQCLQSRDAVLFYNKFIVSGKKD